MASPEDEIYLSDHYCSPGSLDCDTGYISLDCDTGLGGQQAVTPVTDDVHRPGARAGVSADGGGARAAGGPPLPQQLGVKVGMALGVFTEKIKMCKQDEENQDQAYIDIDCLSAQQTYRRTDIVTP